MATYGARYCCVINCSSNNRTTVDPRTNKSVRFHGFPKKDLETWKRWLVNLRREDLTLQNSGSKLVCSLHFEPTAYNCPSDIGNSNLLSTAVPTIVICPHPPASSTPKKKPSKRIHPMDEDSSGSLSLKFSANSNFLTSTTTAGLKETTPEDEDEVVLLDDSESSNSNFSRQSAKAQTETKTGVFSSSVVKPPIIRSENSQSNSSSSTALLDLDESKRLQLKKLNLDENGTFMNDFHPEKSKRELRKLNRRLFSKDTKKNQLYDSQGVYVDNPVDLCDCLDNKCPGCHFPCPKCNSPKCGTDCRCNRKYVVDFIEVEGTDTVYNFPL